MKPSVADAFRFARSSHITSCIDVALAFLDLTGIHSLAFSLAIASVPGKATACMLVLLRHEAV